MRSLGPIAPLLMHVLSLCLSPSASSSRRGTQLLWFRRLHGHSFFFTPSPSCTRGCICAFPHLKCLSRSDAQPVLHCVSASSAVCGRNGTPEVGHPDGDRAQGHAYGTVTSAAAHVPDGCRCPAVSGEALFRSYSVAGSWRLSATVFNYTTTTPHPQLLHWCLWLLPPPPSPRPMGCGARTIRGALRVFLKVKLRFHTRVATVAGDGCLQLRLCASVAHASGRYRMD